MSEKQKYDEMMQKLADIKEIYGELYGGYHGMIREAVYDSLLQAERDLEEIERQRLELIKTDR